MPIKCNPLKQLKYISKSLGKSLGRRDISWKLYLQCVKSFGSFNNAKEKAGLKFRRRDYNPLTKISYRLDKDLVRIVSFLTCDGHLYKDLSGLLLISKNKIILEEFEKIIIRKLNFIGKYRYGMGYYKDCYNYQVFNTKICKFLYSIGVPKGDKMLVKFDIPNWIKNNKQFAKEYLKIAFFCEGCKYNRGNKEEIQINLNKWEELLKDGLNFMNSLKELLSLFNIETTKTWITKGNIRKDEKITKTMRFKIKTNSVNRFINEIGWLK